MPLPHRPWLPTSPGQSAAVLTLTVLLLLNTTVLLLLVSGELSPVSDGFAAQSVERASSQQDQSPLIDRSTVGELTTQQPRPGAKHVPVRSMSRSDQTLVQAAAPVAVPTQTTPSVLEASEPEPANPIASVEPQPVEQDDPPTRFFGLDLN